ncbi:hypothetical protein RIF29_17958 [Crotalaria pallida]|uniref:TIR domain-containing protein n=1 Tax=Crotalaria pallida TaxID=3830 RepID=A0AAN9FI40_CROPI
MAYEGEGADAPNYKYKYDVFFSFRGSDTRNNFIDSVYRGLRQMRLVIFYDDKVLYSEDESKLSVLEAIEESRTSIVFLFSNYASSSWCLDELAKIIECMRSKNHRVYPVYFGVDPSDVRHQKGSYGCAMAKHEERFHQERVQRWRSALHTLSSLSGWLFQRDKEQYEQEIAQMIAEFFSSMVPSFDVFLSSSWGHTCHSFTSFLYNILLKEGFQIVHKSRLDYLAIKVQPSEVRYQLSHYKDAMAKHEEKYGKEEVLKWKLALSEAANLKGWHFQSGYDNEKVEEWRSAMSEVPRSEKWHFKTGEDEYEFIENISGTIVEKEEVDLHIVHVVVIILASR